ncbi:hypothetical protein Elgi_69080 [Paenibacillus elgii]|uniref:glycoside hydrolase family 20 zincin-like fold domain-containing protein n=1 Tax=Paenibacillus elgii TaxID=189691 RepID=UPI002D7B268A|nr:hypothetical protein Elgi_69080 [Paenibacillus elgii]
MQPTIPQVKHFDSTHGSAMFKLNDHPKVTLRSERDDPRLERHCRRAFPGMDFSGELGGKGYALRIASEDSVVAEWADEQPYALADRKEGYLFTIEGSEAVIRALDAAGLFYGMQTLLQLTDQNAGKFP